MSQPIWSMTFDPIQSSAPERSQRRHVIGEQRQTDRKHPQSGDRQKPKHAANREKQSRRNPKPTAGWPSQETNG
jgi:hypothetical protein